MTGLAESLWLDELHTSWTISGSTEDLGSRARAGNQSPLYFWLLRFLTGTLGNSEWVLRTPSVVSSMLCVFLFCRVCQRMAGGPGYPRLQPGASARPLTRAGFVAIVAIAWIGVDRIQLFYATEARVYSCLQLLSLLGWCTAMEIAGRSPGSEQGTTNRLPRFLVIWSVLAVFSIHLHLIAILAVAWQAAFIAISLAWNRCFARLKNTCFALAVVAVGSLPALAWAVPVWQRRQQWAAFAGDASPQNVLQLFPAMQLLIPVGVAVCVDWLLSERRSDSGLRRRTFRQSSARPPERNEVYPYGLLWFVAAAGPLITGWIVTGAGIAPVMHRRYLLCSALPIVLLAAYALLRLKRTDVRIGALLATSLWLTFGQGTLSVWSHGQLVGWQRFEHWRGAAEWTSQQITSSDELWCASGLIEGRAVRPPIAGAMEEYLAFPLSGIYRVRDDSGAMVAPRALYGDSGAWLESLLAESDRARRRAFVVYRGRSASLTRHLKELERLALGRGVHIEIKSPPREFGLVCVVELMIGVSSGSPDA